MNFFRSLFDTSFERFVTIRIARVVYIIAMVLIALAALATFGLAIMMLFVPNQSGTGILLLLFGPVVWLLNLIIVRLWLEYSVALIKVAENTSKQSA